MFHISLHAPTGPAAVDALLRSAVLTAQDGRAGSFCFPTTVLSPLPRGATERMPNAQAGSVSS